MAWEDGYNMTLVVGGKNTLGWKAGHQHVFGDAHTSLGAPFSATLSAFIPLLYPWISRCFLRRLPATSSCSGLHRASVHWFRALLQFFCQLITDTSWKYFHSLTLYINFFQYNKQSWCPEIWLCLWRKECKKKKKKGTFTSAISVPSLYQCKMRFNVPKVLQLVSGRIGSRTQGCGGR